MTDPSTRTSPALVAPFPREAAYQVRVRSVDATTGPSGPTPFYRHPHVTEQASALLSTIHDKRMADTMKEIVDAIEEAVHAFVAAGQDVQALPPVHATTPGDGSVLLEWTLPDFRLGFTVERDPSESGWYVVTSKRLGEIAAHGLLSGVNSRGLIFWVVGFALANS